MTTKPFFSGGLLRSLLSAASQSFASANSLLERHGVVFLAGPNGGHKEIAPLW